MAASGHATPLGRDHLVGASAHSVQYSYSYCVVSLGSIILIGSYFVRPGEDVIEPLFALFGAVVYGVLANLAYTLGWVTELLWSWGDTQRTELLRRRVFWLGVAFSVGLTLLPGVLVPLIWIVFGFQHG